MGSRSVRRRLRKGLGESGRESEETSRESDRGSDRTAVSEQGAGGVGRGHVPYTPGPDPQALSARYGIDFVKNGQAGKIQRLETEFGSDRVSRWVDEGMTVETMGKSRDMAAFRERQEGRPEEVPTDIERQNEASLQRNTAPNRTEESVGDAGVPDAVRTVVSSPGRSLDGTVQREMEAKMGDEFGDVRIHTGPQAAAAAEAINARAFTVGNHITFNQGEYQPGNSEGKRLLAHELTHVRQQTDGAASMLPKTDPARAIDPDPSLEREAEKTAHEMTAPLRTVRRLGTDIHVQRSPGTSSVQSGLSRDAPMSVQRDTKTEAKGRGRELFEQANRHFVAGEYEKALTLFERVRQFPDLPKLSPGERIHMLYNIGVCNLRLRRFATAITYFEQYIDSPNADTVIVEEAKVKLEEARQGAGISPEEMETGEIVGEVTEEADARARELFEQAKRQYEAGAYEHALALLERTRQFPGLPGRREPRLLYNIGLCNVRLRRFATAITYFEQSIAHPNADTAVVGEAKVKLEEARRGADVPTPKFESGDIVKTTDNLRIRAGPGLDQSIEETTPIGVSGDVLEGPVTVDGYVWWKIKYHAGYTGWSAQPWLEEAPKDVEQEQEESQAEETPGDSAIEIGTDEPQPNLEQLIDCVVVTRYYPQTHGSEEEFKKSMIETYFRRNFILLMEREEMKPLVEDLIERLILPTYSFSSNILEGELVGLMVHPTNHQTLKNYYRTVEPLLVSGEIEEAKTIASYWLPVLEEFRTERAFRGGFQNFRIRAIDGGGATITAIKMAKGRVGVSIAVKALLFEFEERSPGKGPLKKTSGGYAYASPPRPQKKTMGYVGFGPGFSAELPVDEADGKVQKMREELEKLKTSEWNSFATPVHMSLEDFEGAGGIAGVSLGIGNLESIYFACPELPYVSIELQPGWSWDLQLGMSINLTGGHWELNPAWGAGDLLMELLGIVEELEQTR